MIRSIIIGMGAVLPALAQGIGAGHCELNVNSHMAWADAHGKQVYSVYVGGQTECVAALVVQCELWGRSREVDYLDPAGWRKFYQSIDYYRGQDVDFTPGKRDPAKPFGVLRYFHCHENYGHDVVDPRWIPSTVPNSIQDGDWTRHRYVHPLNPSFSDLMDWIRDHQKDISYTVMFLIIGTLLVYFGANAVAAFFSGGASLATTPATAALLVAAIIAILQDHGYWSTSSGPRASVQVQQEDRALADTELLRIEVGDPRWKEIDAIVRGTFQEDEAYSFE